MYMCVALTSIYILFFSLKNGLVKDGLVVYIYTTLCFVKMAVQSILFSMVFKFSTGTGKLSYE